jgi:hypothetical protein
VLPTGARPQPAATVIVSSGDSRGPLTLVVLLMISGAGSLVDRADDAVDSLSQIRSFPLQMGPPVTQVVSAPVTHAFMDVTRRRHALHAARPTAGAPRSRSEADSQASRTGPVCSIAVTMRSRRVAFIGGR